jgi:hypothetical protein
LANALALVLDELLSILLGLQLLPIWMLLLLFLLLRLLLLSLLLPLLPSSNPGLPPAFLPFSSLGVDGAALRAHGRRITAGEADALVASERFKNQSGPGACGDVLLVLRQEARGSPTKAGKRRGGSWTHVVPAESSGRRRPSHTAASPWPLRPLSSAVTAQLMWRID